MSFFQNTIRFKLERVLYNAFMAIEPEISTAILALERCGDTTFEIMFAVRNILVVNLVGIQTTIGLSRVF